jgi:hypothetical protein
MARSGPRCPQTAVCRKVPMKASFSLPSSSDLDWILPPMSTQTCPASGSLLRESTDGIGQWIKLWGTAAANGPVKGNTASGGSRGQRHCPETSLTKSRIVGIKTRKTHRHGRPSAACERLRSRISDRRPSEERPLAAPARRHRGPPARTLHRQQWTRKRFKLQSPDFVRLDGRRRSTSRNGLECQALIGNTQRVDNLAPSGNDPIDRTNWPIGRT